MRIAGPVFLIFAFMTLIFADLAFAQVPRSLTLAHSTFASRSLGGICYSFDTEDGLPCNPAFITLETPKSFGLKAFGSNNISYLDDARSVLDGEIDAERIERMMSQTRDSKMEFSTEASYRRPGFGISITPFQVKYFSFIRNRALPQLTLLAAREQNLRVQFGGGIESEGAWGVEIRGVKRKFVARSFSIVDVAVEGGKELFAREQQTALYLEPGLMRRWDEYEWSPSVSASLVNLGFTDKKYDSFRNSPELHMGSSIRPPVSLGAWQIGVDGVLHNEVRELSDVIRFGSVYEFGITRLSGSFGLNDHTFGLQMRYGFGIAGIVYQSQLIENWLAEEEWLRTLSVQIGAEF